MITPLEISPNARESLMDQLRDFLTSDAQVPLARETDWVALLDAELEAAGEIIETRPNSPSGWTRYVYASALKRSIEYATARRGTLIAHGANNEFREVYEGSRQADAAKIA